jgi:flagellar biosynthesis protein FlhG
MDQAEKLRNEVRSRKNFFNKVIAVTSGKGGVGKTNIAINLAVCFRKMGKRVIIFDADFGLANVEIMFGQVPKYDLSDLLYKGMRIKDIITEGPMGIGFISGGSGILSLNNISADQLDKIVLGLEELNDLCDILIVDTGAGVSDNVIRVALSSSEILIVTTPEPSSLTDAYSLVKALVMDPKFAKFETNLRIVVNKVRSDREAKAVFNKMQSVSLKFLDTRLKYQGMIPYDTALDRAVKGQKVVSLEEPSSKSARAISYLAESLIDGDESIVKENNISRFFRLISGKK